MPVYEYECGHCRHRFEVKQGFHDKPQAECPQCHGKARRVFQPTPIIFKGSGFYVNDSRKSTGTEKSKGEPEKSKGEPEKSKGESGKSKGESEKSKGESGKSKGESETGKSPK
jgi:putative FmdB family regulatory protein